MGTDSSLVSKLIMHYLNYGADATFYKKKRLVLGEIFGTSSNEIDCQSNVSPLLCNHFPKNILYSFENILAGSKRQNLYVPININIIENNGINNLSAAITCKADVKFNHVLIFEINYIKVASYPIDDLPKCLNIKGDEYTLKAFINFIPPPPNVGEKAIGHYQSYNFRPDGQIQLYDNQTKNCKALSKNVRPELLIFIKE